MVKTEKPQASLALKWTQIAHSILTAPFFIFAALSDSYVIKLESGESIDIAAHHGLLWQLLLWSVVLILVAQVISIWRLSTFSIVLYAWCGTWLVLVASALAMSGEFLSKELQNLSTGGQWVLDFLGVDFKIAHATVETGSAWIWILLGAISFVAFGTWQFVEKIVSYQRMMKPQSGN